MTAVDSDLIRELIDEMRVVRQVLDELRSELRWANNNRLDPPSVPGQLRPVVSLPQDPADPDWPAKVNDVDEATVQRLRDEAATPSPTAQQHLFEP